MKKFTIPCDFGGKIAPFDVYIGRPTPGLHPLEFQRRWLQRTRGGEIPARTLDAFSRLLELADKNQVPFEDLCVYALEQANAAKATAETAPTDTAPTESTPTDTAPADPNPRDP